MTTQLRDTEDMAFTIMADEYEKDRTTTVTHGRTINQNRKNTDSVDNPFPKYKERMEKQFRKSWIGKWLNTLVKSHLLR